MTLSAKGGRGLTLDVELGLGRREPDVGAERNGHAAAHCKPLHAADDCADGALATATRREKICILNFLEYGN